MMYNKSKFKVPSLELEITLSHTLSVFWYNERPSIARWKAFHFVYAHTPKFSILTQELLQLHNASSH